MFSCVLFPWCKLVSGLGFLRARRWRLETCQHFRAFVRLCRGDSQWTSTQNKTQLHICGTPNFSIGLDIKLLSTLFCPSRKPEPESWIRCRSYLFLWILVRLSVCMCVCMCVQGWRPVYVALSMKKELHEKVWWTLMPHRDWAGSVEHSSTARGKKRKYIYNSILCRIFIGLLCRWSHALPCDHYTSSCTDDPWLIWLFFFPCQVHFSQ